MTHVWWYTARAGGLVAWAVLTASVVWGLALSSKALGGKPRPAWLLDLHRFLGALAVIFTGVHIVGIVADSYVHFGVADVLVPLASGWHPVAVAWGVVALWLLAAVELTSLARRWLPRALWRRTHYVSFPLFIVATVHGLSAGSDARGPVAVGVVTATTAVVAALVAARFERRTAPSRLPARAAAVRPSVASRS